MEDTQESPTSQGKPTPKAPAQGESPVHRTSEDAPLPWAAVFPEGSNGWWSVIDAKGQEVAACYYARLEAKERAKRIAQVVNCLEKLVAGLRAYGSHVHGPVLCERAKHSDYPCTCGLDALLAEAEGRAT